MNHSRESRFTVLSEKLVHGRRVQKVDLVQVDEVGVGWESFGDPSRASERGRRPSESVKALS